MSTPANTAGSTGSTGSTAGDGAPPARRWLTRHRNTPAPPPATLHEVGPHFVIAPGGPHGPDPTALPAALTDALAQLPPVIGTVTVLAAAADAQPVLLGSLDELARTAAARKAATLVLAASGLAAAPEAGRRPAQRIAELAATSIVAPDGLVTLRPDGTLLTTGATEQEPSSWWLFTPAGRTRRLGPVWPLPTATPQAQAQAAAPQAAPPVGTVTAPQVSVLVAAPQVQVPTVAAAQAAPPVAAVTAPQVSLPGAAPSGPPAPAPALPAPAPATPTPAAPTPVPTAGTGSAEPGPPGGDGDPLDGDPLVTVLPRGYWFRSGPAPDGPPGALAHATAAPGTLVLVVGHPGTPLPAAADLAARLRRSRPAPADLLVSAPWAATTALVALAAGLAAELGRDVRAAVGLPMRTADGFSSRLLTTDGTPAWEPWLTELTASPDLGRVVASAWRPLPDGSAPCGPALHRAPVAGWHLEAVPAGLWLRPEDPPQDHGPRLLDPDPARPLLIAGSAERTVPAEVLAVLDGLLSSLTVPGTAAPELLVHAGSVRETGRTAAPVAEPLRPGPDTEPAPAPAPDEDDPDSADTPGPDSEPATATGTGTGTGENDPDSADSPAPQAEPATTPVAGSSAGSSAGLSAESGIDSPAEAPAAQPRLVPPDGALVAGRPSTAAERAAFRALLGAHFHRYASRAEQAALRLPALRSQARDDLKDDLAAVYLHHADTGIPVHRAELVEAARRTGPRPLDAYLACLGSGLRRLPNHRGTVLLGADAGEEVLRHYVRGALLTEPAPMVGTPEADLAPDTSVEFLVWSATGRRTSVIAEDGDPEVVFPPGSWFCVLDVLPGDEDHPTRVLLREAGPSSAGGETAGERDQQARVRLLAWQARRDLLPAEHRRAPARPERLRLTPGVAVG
ncbi:hypothetical protein KV557_19720 [Kitasatospora aureofaciens]|uniref:hypothetical protein n=1 Tax=Kitasatospora aureofaciens TaxID=1894 RepID=UPI001C47E7D1|nr:hypothetical protein [Kitasatospora aureofaciens]MBV6699325.1 hypothetical protein [Kitasatospora aureofaciens]